MEELCPKLTGADRYKKEADLKSVMKKSSKSVAAVTSVTSVEGITADKLYESMDDNIEEACFSDQNLKDIDRRAKQQFALMLFCCNKVLILPVQNDQNYCVCVSYDFVECTERHLAFLKRL